jgi:hypothetical protein
VALAVAEMKVANAHAYTSAGKRRYPGSSHVCDLALGAVPDWAIEVKLARLGHDNGGRSAASLAATYSALVGYVGLSGDWVEPSNLTSPARQRTMEDLRARAGPRRVEATLGANGANDSLRLRTHLNSASERTRGQD